MADDPRSPTGTVYIAWEQDHRVYDGYWDALPDEKPAHLEQMPRTPSIEEALRWGRARADRVVIRPESAPTTYHWAGVGPNPDEGDDLPDLPER